MLRALGLVELQDRDLPLLGQRHAIQFMSPSSTARSVSPGLGCFRLTGSPTS